jgi:1-acyl-sn-glycerol-3-phosphate acyltransferase
VSPGGWKPGVGVRTARLEYGELAMTDPNGRRRPSTRDFPVWPRWWWVRLVRRFLFATVVRPVARLSYGIEVRGAEHFEQCTVPCLIVGNHNLHLDQSILLSAMPRRFRQRVAIAAAAEDIFGNRARGFGSALLGNAFPFAKQGAGVRDSLEYVQYMLEDGWHVLLFPEGKLTELGPMQPFRGGVGLLAREAGAAVLPMRIDVRKPAFWDGSGFRSPRGRVVVSVGPPITIAGDARLAEATARLEAAVRDA